MTETKTKHSEWSASGCERWWNCPGSVALCRNEPDKTSVYAAEGSLAHDICSDVLNQKKKLDDLDTLIGDTVMVDGHEIEITEEMIDAVVEYVQFITEVSREIGLDANNVRRFMHVEQKFSISEDVWGTADCAFIIPFDRIVVIDFKYGAGIAVDVKDNKQLMMYALGVFKDNNHDITEVETIIVQPRSRHKDGSIRRDICTVQELVAFGKELEQKIQDTKQKNPALNTGDWCRFCSANYKCPALAQQSTDLAVQAFETEPNITQLSVKQISDILDKKSVIEAFLKNVAEYALHLLQQGEEVPGYKMVQGRAGNRFWTDQQEVINAYGKLGDKIWEKKIVSPTKMEKILRDSGMVKSVKEAKVEIDKYVDRNEGKLTIVPEYDKRDEVVLDTGKLFE